MLANLLSGKSFLPQIFLGIAFLVFFLFNIYPINFNWETITGIIFYLLNAIILFAFINSSSLFTHPGIGIWFLVFWLMCFSDIVYDFRLSVSLFIITLMFWRFLSAEQSLESKSFSFDIGILLSIACFFYPPFLFLGGLVIFNYFYLQSINLKALLLFLIGFLLPILVGLQVLFLTDRTDWLQSYQTAFYLNTWHFRIWALLPIGVLLVFAWLDHLTNSAAQDINKRHSYFLIFLFFINLIIIIFLFGGNDFTKLTFLGLPIAVFLARFTHYLKTNWVKDVVLIGYLLCLLGFFFQEEILQIYDDLLGNVAF